MYPVEFYAKRNSFCNGDCMYRMDAVVFDIILKGLHDSTSCKEHLNYTPSRYLSSMSVACIECMRFYLILFWKVWMAVPVGTEFLKLTIYLLETNLMPLFEVVAGAQIAWYADRHGFLCQISLLRSCCAIRKCTSNARSNPAMRPVFQAIRTSIGGWLIFVTG